MRDIPGRGNQYILSTASPTTNTTASTTTTTTTTTTTSSVKTGLLTLCYADNHDAV